VTLIADDIKEFLYSSGESFSTTVQQIRTKKKAFFQNNGKFIAISYIDSKWEVILKIKTEH